jgi:alkylhydroperoxidase family enzyme
MVRIASTGEVDATDPGSARPELTAILTFLEKVTCSPDSVSASDLDQVREAGIPDDAVIEALHVAFVWNVVDRLAHAFDYQLSEGQLKKGTQALHQFKYKLPGFTLR